MIADLKALLVILVIAAAVFIAARPLCLHFMSAPDFARRRNVWFALTAFAFVCPNYWLFILGTGLVYVWSSRRDSNPLALYLLMLHVIPPSGLEIPPMGSTRFFDLDNYRLLALTELLPFAIKASTRLAGEEKQKFSWMDIFLLAYGALQLILLLPYESVASTTRRTFLFAVDNWLIYYAFSRGVRSSRMLLEAMAAFCLACAIYAPLAAFEAIKVWPLYGGLADKWGLAETAYVFRGSSLRALASAGHPLALGYLMSIGFGFWLMLRLQVDSWKVTLVVAMWMWLGLVAAYSRAPWLVAMFIFFCFLALQPGGTSKLLKALLIGAVLGGVVLASPFGEKIIDSLPFVGTVDSETVVYRQRLADVSWRLIEQNPLFGDPFALNYMEEMRQGEGIIDLVNTFATIALFQGLVGVTLFSGVFVMALWNVFWSLRRWVGADRRFALVGANLLACIAGTLIMMVTGSFGTGLAALSWVLAGMASSYSRLAWAPQAE